MQKSVRKYYEHKRSYDRAEYDTVKGRRVVKKRAHKRLRKQLEHSDDMIVFETGCCVR